MSNPSPYRQGRRPSRWPRLAGLALATLMLQNAAAGEPGAPSTEPGLGLSPALLGLLREEMGALAGGLRTLATAIPTGDWPAVADTAERMEASYIMKQRLTAEQRKELAATLPGDFKRLDARFHEEAGRLAEAARDRDADRAALHLYGLVASCTTCHAEFAGNRFPGFAKGRRQAAVKVTQDGRRELIVLESPRPDERVGPPLTVTGRARGSWYFEGDFPVVLTDWDGRIIAEGYATAQGPWMTSNFVPFTASIPFDVPDYGDYGFLILRKDNPSGRPEHDDALEIRVRFDRE